LEINIECVKKDLTIQKVTAIIEEAVKRCNDFFGFRVPMEMDIKVGGTWKEIH
jgi:DNA polymerase I-like protein with 3'-5' exonuclease and polymerase domains